MKTQSPSYSSLPNAIRFAKKRGEKALAADWLTIDMDCHVWLDITTGRYFTTRKMLDGYDGRKNHLWQGRLIYGHDSHAWKWMPAAEVL